MGGIGAWHLFRQGRAEHGQLQVPRGELLGGERVAHGGGERRVDLLVAHGRGVEGGIEAGA